ncbi:hypothetical protein B0T24DRAFT_365503 [Lasiosphaeria ovina]|uniref:Aminoglycoside phosphotransferase domain-containing protein n=1 Tax=Lasiosphaeria ovina TaxID=92902 RepID=A0AAE0K518_9PEZI|nr:hypothetical protein B0T24DRAFT_365503 [Lasiosphaeria ovina]
MFSLPMVLLHHDIGDANIMVDEKSCHLVGVVDWAEAESCPFCLNLYTLQALMGKLHLKNGWTLYDDHGALQDVFWDTLEQEVEGLSEETIRTVKNARITGCYSTRVSPVVWQKTEGLRL